MIKDIFWDFDGVICDSVNVKTLAFKELYLPYGEDVAAKVVEHHEANGGVSRFEKFKIYHREFLGEEIDQNKVDELASNFSNLVLQKVVEAPYINGVIEFIQSHQKDMNHYVISGTPDDEMKTICDKKNISSLFHSIHGSPTSKTDWSNSLIERHELNNNEILFIGDSTSDYKAAVNCNLHFILRETPENQNLFKDYEGIRIKDFLNFDQIIGRVQ